ncbi:DEAD/DEAH box helicase family protein [Dactylosporangium cerinum]|uniref:DEAD/DEAH box helicase family protein n=1 Tax=Dactylosporangium cerinum TaxID=1434730 RepID=A0ABV9VQ92_9ACTN
MSGGSLRGIGLRDHFRSDTDDMVRDFYGPCLSAAVRYDRAVGYFTSTSLALAANGLQHLTARDGRIRLIASPHLSAEDIDQIELGYEYRAVIAAAVQRELGEHVERSPTLLAKLGLLGRLVGDGVLDLRIAVVRRNDRLALYHEKIGVFVDEHDDMVAFSGSSNETASALLYNFESVEVFQGWVDGEAARVNRIATDFDNLWSGTTHNVEVLPFPDLGKERLLQLSRVASKQGLQPEGWQSDSGVLIGTRAGSYPTPRLPAEITLHGYQKDAIRKWFSADGRGVFQMATGTGKTVAALAAVSKMAEIYDRQQKPLLAVVVAPQIHLVDQWADEAKRFGLHALCCYDDAKSWVEAANALTIGLSARPSGFGMLITTNATFGRPGFQDLLAAYQGPFVLVADEAHNLGARSALAALPSFAPHRMALTATPERWFDPDGTRALADYFGDPVIELGLREAISIGALCEYDYYPIPVALDEEESALYAQLTQRIGRLFGDSRADSSSPVDDGNDQLSMLLRRRSQLLAHARGKLAALQAQVALRADQSWQLLYCAEGVAPQDGAERQVDSALRLVGSNLGIPSHQYTAAETPTERRRILERFRSGDLRALVSMRCLDEGVDIPDARIAYMLASSTNPRQFIQRRGRILRKSKGKDFAQIVDFIAVPGGHVDIAVERRLLRREITRFADFASTARNAGEALSVMRPMREAYGLMDV